MANNEKGSDFPLINRAVCLYCKNPVVVWSGEDSLFGCKFEKKEDKYLSVENDLNNPNYFEGCDKFESSGIPVHPSLLEELIESNSLMGNVPVSGEAIEKGIVFEQKVTYNLPESQRVEWGEIQES